MIHKESDYYFVIKKCESSYTCIPVKTNLIHEKHIHHLMVLCLIEMVIR